MTCSAFLKRVIDIFVSATALVLLFPLFLLIAFAVRIKLGSPVLFTQTRPGLNGKPFKMVKFRSMRDLRDEKGELLDDSLRMHAFGSFLRKSSLDEIPELYNVLKGEMSLVGPRPLLMAYLPLYSPDQARRHDVKPGVTGWAQVNGRNNLSWDERFEMDQWYVKNRSLFLDLKILFLTFAVVFRRKGISTEGHVTSPVFKPKNPAE